MSAFHDKADENWPVRPLPEGTYINDSAQLAVAMDIRAAVNRSNQLLGDILYQLMTAPQVKRKRSTVKLITRQATRPSKSKGRRRKK